MTASISYRGVGFKNYVILATGFTLKTANEIEHALELACYVQNDTRQKYHPDRLGQPFHKGGGGSTRYSKNRAYVIYMVWC
jgi:hypothetical protein